MKNISLMLALCSAPVMAEKTLPINESVEPNLRKELYRGLFGCAAFHKAMAKYPMFSAAPQTQNEAKSAKFLSAAHLFRDDKDVAKTAIDFEDSLRDFDKSFRTDPEERVRSLVDGLSKACATAEEYADLALTQNFSLKGK